MLTSEKIIVESDGDIEIVSTIVAGYDYLNNFVVKYIYDDYRKNGKGYEYSAVVDEEDAKILADSLKVSLADLPVAIYDEFGDTTGQCASSEVEGVLKDILEWILDCGVKYRLNK